MEEKNKQIDNKVTDNKATKPEGKKFSPVYILAIVIIVAVLAAAAYVLTRNSTSAQTVAIGDNVSVYYTGTFTNGTVFDTNVGKQPLQFTAGAGQVIQGFDQAVVGMRVNETKNVTIPPNQAYGQLNPNLIVSIPLSQFGNKSVNVGMIVTERTGGGQELQGFVTAVNSTAAKVNFNQPLAGDTLLFKIRVISVQKRQ